ncbi:alpha/beta hydrolase [Desulfobotulus sp. H1]|uniref:Alpha/beta hydrolase n=1 Tax=Desulfobotulus pelophilus TaxID=2823377 RepID=A0ABT3N7L9_9BACT|nr:alpha/beta hydrolase [Desulfobotulus pelophilus]MCW7753449.1 alpha/beta hydrolase [Desulfobotulus pelophilus]
MKHTSLQAFTCWLLFFIFAASPAAAQWPRMTPSQDGVPISYEVYGKGEPTLIFVHGWSCDARYWREQVAHFSKKNRMVLLDLAGHGHSGMGRSQYTMKAFGEDVKAVAEAVGSKEVILIGHSMGGPVIAEAARLMPGRVLGLIGVDTFGNVAHPLTPEILDGMVSPLEEDFQTGSRPFVETMMVPATPAPLREWILSDMAAAPPAVALSALKEMMGLFITGESAAIFQEVRLPVMAVNADLWPIDYESNRRHMASFEATVIKGADHFLMLARPAVFNPALEEAVGKIMKKK